jgi:hypothetical protein
VDLGTDEVKYLALPFGEFMPVLHRFPLGR